MNDLQWTTEFPGNAGFYFAVHADEEFDYLEIIPEVVYLDFIDADEYGDGFWTVRRRHDDEHYEPSEFTHWAGPIPATKNFRLVDLSDRESESQPDD